MPIIPVIISAAVSEIPVLVDIISGWMKGDDQATYTAKWNAMVGRFQAASAEWDAQVAAKKAKGD